MTLQLTKEDMSTEQGVVWAREEPNVLDSHWIMQHKISTHSAGTSRTRVLPTMIMSVIYSAWAGEHRAP